MFLFRLQILRAGLYPIQLEQRKYKIHQISPTPVTSLHHYAVYTQEVASCTQQIKLDPVHNPVGIPRFYNVKCSNLILKSTNSKRNFNSERWLSELHKLRVFLAGNRAFRGKNQWITISLDWKYIETEDRDTLRYSIGSILSIPKSFISW